MGKNIWEINPESPFVHQAQFIQMKAKRCDLRGGFDIILSRDCTRGQLVNGISECIGYHAVNIRANLPPGHGFTGYGHHQMRFLWDDGEEADLSLIS